MKKNHRMLLRSFSKHKGQYIALMLLVAIGIAIYLCFVMAVYNLDHTIKTYYKDYNAASLYISYDGDGDAIVEGLRENPDVLTVEERSVLEGQAVFAEDAKIRMLSAPTSINLLYLEQGNIQVSGNEVLVLKSFADARKIKIGDSFTVKYRGATKEVLVKGIVSSSEFIYLMENEKAILPAPRDYGVLYFSDSFIESLVGADFQNEILIKTKVGTDNTELAESIKKDFGKLGVTLASTQEQQLSYRMAKEEINGEIKMANSLPALFLLVAIIILSITISKLVENDRRSIGILKAIGYTNRSIFWYYTKFTLIIGLSGAFVGIIAGGIVSYQFTGIYSKMFQIPVLAYHFDPKYIFQAILIAIGFSTLSGLLGARKVLKLSPDEAMKPPALKKGKHIWLERFKGYQALKYTRKMLLRNVFRHKRRFALMVLGVALSSAMIFIPFALSKVLDGMYLDQYGEYQVYDYDLSFVAPLTDAQINTVRDEIKDGIVEPYISTAVDLSFGEESRTIELIGIADDSKIFHLANQNEKEITLEKNGFALSEGLANSFNIKVGDTITLKTIFGESKSIDVIVTDIVQQKLGTNGYLLGNDLQEKFFGGAKLYTGVYVQGDVELQKIESNPLIQRVVSVAQIMSTFQSFNLLIDFSIGVMVALGGVLGFVMIYVLSLQAINERMGELSTLRVLGLTQREIFGLISSENMIASIFGIVVGIPIGKFMLDGIGRYLSNDLYSLIIGKIEPSMILYTAFWTLIFVLLGQGMTRVKIQRMNFLDSLKQRIS